MKSREEITKVVDQAGDIIVERSSKFPGMSYEEGVRAGLEWALEESEEHPLDD